MKKKFLIIIVLFAVLGVSLLIQPTEGKTKPYYSGKAVGYGGTFYVGTVNTGNFELFALQNGQLNKVATIQSLDAKNKQFYDLLFDKTDGGLYLYLVNGRYLYKYDISNPEAPAVLFKIKDSSWDWFSRLTKVNGNLVTIGSKGAKIWNSDMQVIDSYKMVVDKDLGYYTFVDDGKYVINLKDDLGIYSTASREKVAEYSIANDDNGTTRAVASDDSLIYLVDDEALKAVNLDGEVVKQFNHVGSYGYDVIESTNSNYLYFSDGLGIVKVNKNNFNSVDWSWTTNHGPSGSWAMGLASANDSDGEKIAIFNGSNIMIVDDDMNILATYKAVEKDTNPANQLALSLDKNSAAAGSQILVSGTGFALNETVSIKLSKYQVAEVKTDDTGSFQTVIIVPSINGPLSTDIKVIGQSSKLTYSTTFHVE
jgi:hypothetical protein